MESASTRRLVIAIAGVICAPVVGWDIAQGNLLLPALFGGALLLGILARWVGVQAGALLCSVLLVGYLVGNRGFAQLNAPGIPLLPGELVVAVSVALVAWHAARTQRLPIQRDAINGLVLLWILVGVCRIPFDFRDYRIVALRDFAMIYYAVFFFAAQSWAAMAAERRLLERALTLGLALCGPVFYLFDLRQEWFTSNLTLGGVPLIFVKSDVAGGFMAAAVIWFADRHAATRNLGWLVVAAAALFSTVVCNSRAAIVALLAGLLWLVLVRAWRQLWTIGALIAVGLFVLGVHSAVDRRPFSESPLFRIYESATSMADIQGTRTYQTANLSDKPDNNQFRLVWWRTVIDETVASGLWFGLGFGRDLAAEFLRAYYADAIDDFTARSPHNILFTVFGRMGVVGSTVLLALIVALANATWKAGRHALTVPYSVSRLRLWLTVWTLLVSACFGVVLEGPMGAVVFWTVLGMANAQLATPPEPSAATTTPTSPLQATSPSPA
ncbi:MAG: O-antigen ligase family protein [Verrucomicrobia bacterium]|nr:O-antigen ligase family protein [Verrucomicrobiota bacterium]